MPNNKELYTFLMDQSAQLAEEWTKHFSDDPDMLFSTADPDRLKKLKVENQLLVEQGLFFSSLDDWIQKVARKLHQKKAPLDEIIKQLRKVRMIYWEAIGDFTDTRSAKIAHQEILLWSDLVYIAFEEIMDSFRKYYKEAEKEQKSVLKEPAVKPVILSEESGILPLRESDLLTEGTGLLRDTVHACREQGVKVLYLDLSCLPQLNAVTASQIYQLCTSLQAIGLDCSVTGISREMAKQAETLAEGLLGCTLYPSLMAALQYRS